MKDNPRIGLLPLFLKLYDDRVPQMRTELERFLGEVLSRFEGAGVEVVQAPICRVEPEFRDAVQSFVERKVDLIVTLHLAYSPSGESIDVLVETGIPLLMLDTTLDYDFGPDVDPKRILYNHGIHGVQDLACMLRRRKRPYQILAGHFAESNVIYRAIAIARAARGVAVLRRTKALRIGTNFEGMGDFAVPDEVMRDKLGITVETRKAADLKKYVKKLTEEDLQEEMARDREAFQCHVSEEVHRRSTRVGLALRKCLEEGGYNAFSMNFLAFDSGEGPIDTVPFLEVSKAMARSIGYGGEGDVLTASLVGALSHAFGKTTFTEIFCPDWKGNSVFLSHMGEINPEVAAGKPDLIEKPFPFTDAANPAFISCAPAKGPAVLVNLAPGPDDSFRIILAPVDILDDTGNAEMRKSLRGWVRPKCPLAEFLERYSELGGTHHSALVLGDRTEAITVFASFLGVECCVIR